MIKITPSGRTSIHEKKKLIISYVSKNTKIKNNWCQIVNKTYFFLSKLIFQIIEDENIYKKTYFMKNVFKGMVVPTFYAFVLSYKCTKSIIYVL
jgi:hypothetical protein